MVFLPVRDDEAFLVALISVVPWIPTNWEASVVLICADDGYMWQALGLLREAVAWAKRRKCVEIRISSETAYDIGPMAMRVGASEMPPRYSVRFP